ncbi:hypothetical protein HGM15179_021581, partial [Zosterops borbonicus]
SEPRAPGPGLAFPAGAGGLGRPPGHPWDPPGHPRDPPGHPQGPEGRLFPDEAAVALAEPGAAPQEQNPQGLPGEDG